MAEIKTRIIIRNDTKANWEAVNPVLKLGEFGVETDTKIIKVGDGVSQWTALSAIVDNAGLQTAILATVDEKITAATESLHQTEVFSASSVDELSSAALKGDIGIVQTLIDGDKYEYTAYIHNGEAWVAMDGNYNAENVYFDEDLITTSAIGNVTLSNGQATIAAKGKNLKEVFNTIFVKESNPSITQPAVSITLTGAGAKEVGTVFTPSYSASLSAGSYTYGPATGVTATSYKITDTNGNQATTASGSFESFTVNTSTSYTVSAEIAYGDGTIPVTNVGNAYAAGQIKAGTKTKTSGAVTGYRAWFEGYKNAGGVLDVSALTSAQIRALTSKKDAFSSSMTTNQMQQMFFAAPAGVVKSVAVANSTNGAPQTVTKTSVNVEGANGFEAIAYDVFYVSNATAESGSTKFNITVTK